MMLRQDFIYGRSFVSKLWHDIRAVFFHVYVQSFLIHDIRAFFWHVYLRSFPLCGVFIPKYMTIFLQTRIYMRTKKPIYMRYKQACAYGVTESRRIRGIELYRQQKSPSFRMELKSNVSLNLEQGLFLIHCPHSSGGCWLPDNGFVGIRRLSLERLCTLFHECWPKQRSIQLEMSVWQAEHDS